MKNIPSTQKKILESIDPSYHSVYLEWYKMGTMLTEAQISQKQIQDIFSAIEAGVAAGKNVDAPGSTTPKGSVPKRGILGSINAGWLKFKEKIAQSEPVSNFDIKFDKLQGQILDKVGGSGGSIGKALEAYKAFGQKFPKIQSAIYYGLVIAAAASGWGLGATAVMAALRTMNGLLQGERFSSAAWKGVKSMVLGAAASEIFGALAGDAQAADVPAAAAAVPDVTYTVQSGDTLSQIAQSNNVSVDELMQANPQITNPDVLKAGQEIKIPSETGSAVYDKGVGTAADTLKGIETGKYTDSPISRAGAAKWGLTEMIDLNRMQRTWNLQESLRLPYNSPVYITQAGVATVVAKINEGLWDTLKQKFTASNITKDKLDLFWRKNYGEYSKAESVDVKTFVDFLHRMGVKDGLIKQTFSDFKIPMDGVAPSDMPKGKDPGSEPPAGGSGPGGVTPGGGAGGGKPSGGAAQGFTSTVKPPVGDVDPNTRIPSAIRQGIQQVDYNKYQPQYKINKFTYGNQENPAGAGKSPMSYDSGKIKLPSPTASTFTAQKTEPSKTPRRVPQGGGKVPGELSQTPNAIRKREQRKAKKTDATQGLGGLGDVVKQLTLPKPSAVKSTGGINTPTIRGRIHTASPTNKNKMMQTDQTSEVPATKGNPKFLKKNAPTTVNESKKNKFSKD